LETSLKENSASNAFIRLGLIYSGILKEIFSLVEYKGREIRGGLREEEGLQECFHVREFGGTLIENEDESRLLRRIGQRGFEIIRKVLTKLNTCGKILWIFSA